MITVRNLQKTFGSVHVLSGITLSIAKGEFVCLLGLSGAGKTTLLRCLNGLAPGAQGEIEIVGEHLTKTSDLHAIRRQVGMIFQHFNLVPRLTAIQNVLTGISGSIPLIRSLFGFYTREEMEFARHCLRRVGLAGKEDQRADTLSGGEKQRVAIARALAQKPKVILADEPVSSVDPKVGRQILVLLQSIAKEDQITVLCNMHNLEMAKEFSDRIIGMANGVVVFDGKPNQLDERALGAIYLTSEGSPDVSPKDPPIDPVPSRVARSHEADGRKTAFYVAASAAIIFVLGWSAVGTELSPYNFVRGLPQMADFFGRMFPPNLSRLPDLVTPLRETIQIAIWGTLLAILLGIPLGLMAAQNVTTFRPLYLLARSVLNLCRGVSELVFALLFVAAVGLGPFPGVLALAVHNLGMLGKFYGDSIENVDPGPVDALYSTGASKLQVIRWAIFPQILPDFVSFNLYRFEVSVRAATVLGLVGAGGIGFPLITSLRLFRYDETTTILIAIVLMVVVTDAAASWLRRRII